MPEIKQLNWTLVLYLSFFLGFFGVDRFVMGKIGTGILKLITFGGFGVWWFIDLLLIMNSYKFNNIEWVLPPKKWVHITVIIAIFLICVAGNKSASNNNLIQTTNNMPTQNTVEIADTNFAQFNTNLWKSTELQREELWKKYKGQAIKWTFYVKTVDKDFFGTYTVIGVASEPNQYTIKGDVVVKFEDSEKDKLLQYSKGDLITILGKLDDYHEILKSIDVSDAVIVKTEEMKYADEGRDSKYCQDLKQMCESGSDCTGYLVAKQEKIC